jgi:hypothetical protein
MPTSDDLGAVKLTSEQREFLRRVRDDTDAFGWMRRHDFGYGWAIEAGLVTKHPAWFEFYITPAGRRALAAAETTK